MEPGVAAAAIVFNAQGQVFLALRGAGARNERGCWEFPGGKVEFGEALRDTVCREFLEEYGMTIAVDDLFGVFEYLHADDGRHWVSATFLAHLVSGEPQILEPEKCAAIGWFAWDALPAPLAKMTADEIADYHRRFL